MWNAWLPLHLECTCTGYVPWGRPEKVTARSEGGARAAATEAGEGDGLAGAEVEAGAGEESAATAVGIEVVHDTATIPTTSAESRLRIPYLTGSGYRPRYAGQE
jgi:hypothetical protein